MQGPLRGHVATGPLNRPKLPGIPGIETFKGHTFHTSRWDYDYTGGDTTGEPAQAGRQAGGDHRHRRDRRSSACRTSAQARQAALRLPAHALVGRRARQQADRSGLGEDLAEPGWQKRRMENFNILVTGGPQDEDLVSDGWTDIIRNLGGLLARRNRRQADLAGGDRRAGWSWPTSRR